MYKITAYKVKEKTMVDLGILSLCIILNFSIHYHYQEEKPAHHLSLTLDKTFSCSDVRTACSFKFRKDLQNFEGQRITILTSV